MMNTTASSASPGFFFVGGALALDLVNTEIVARGRRKDLLDSPGDVQAWWHAAREHYPEALRPGEDLEIGPEVVDAVRSLRATVRRLFESVSRGGVPDSASIAALNAILRRGEHVIEHDDDGHYHAPFRARAAGADTLLVPVAWSAQELLTASDLTRLHECANERCILLFYDTTKSGTRRWCSTGCMNRARSAERYRAEKAAAT